MTTSIKRDPYDSETKRAGSFTGPPYLDASQSCSAKICQTTFLAMQNHDAHSFFFICFFSKSGDARVGIKPSKMSLHCSSLE